MLVDDDSLSWSRRRDLYRAWMTAGDALVLVARRAGAAVGYGVAHLQDGPADTFAVGTRYAELVLPLGAASFRSSWSSGASGRPETTRAAQWAARSPGIGSLAADL